MIAVPTRDRGSCGEFATPVPRISVSNRLTVDALLQVVDRLPRLSGSLERGRPDETGTAVVRRLTLNVPPAASARSLRLRVPLRRVGTSGKPMPSSVTSTMTSWSTVMSMRQFAGPGVPNGVRGRLADHGLDVGEKVGWKGIHRPDMVMEVDSVVSAVSAVDRGGEAGVGGSWCGWDRPPIRRSPSGSA